MHLWTQHEQNTHFGDTLDNTRPLLRTRVKIQYKHRHTRAELVSVYIYYADVCGWAVTNPVAIVMHTL